jgi:sulfide dehydrogenase cytochrome subunit
MRVFCLALSSALILIAGSAAAADPAPPTQQCTPCHGVDGISRWPDVPNIAGLPEVVIANSLYDFRGHARPCRKPVCAEDGACPPLDMCLVAEPLTDGQMDVLARFYSARPFGAAANEYDARLAAVGKQVHDKHCEGCHTLGGSDPMDEASILRGQNRTYIANAIADYRSGRRLGEAAMLKRLNALNEEEVVALVEFYASPQEP